MFSFCAKSFCDRPLAALACARARRRSIDTVCSFMGASESSSSSWRILTPAAVCFEAPPLAAGPPLPPDLLPGASSINISSQHCGCRQSYRAALPHTAECPAHRETPGIGFASHRHACLSNTTVNPRACNCAFPSTKPRKKCARTKKRNQGAQGNLRARTVLGEDDGLPVLCDVRLAAERRVRAAHGRACRMSLCAACAGAQGRAAVKFSTPRPPQGWCDGAGVQTRSARLQWQASAECGRNKHSLFSATTMDVLWCVCLKITN